MLDVEERLQSLSTFLSLPQAVILELAIIAKKNVDVVTILIAVDQLYASEVLDQ